MLYVPTVNVRVSYLPSGSAMDRLGGGPLRSHHRGKAEGEDRSNIIPAAAEEEGHECSREVPERLGREHGDPAPRCGGVALVVVRVHMNDFHCAQITIVNIDSTILTMYSNRIWVLGNHSLEGYASPVTNRSCFDSSQSTLRMPVEERADVSVDEAVVAVPPRMHPAVDDVEVDDTPVQDRHGPQQEPGGVLVEVNDAQKCARILSSAGVGRGSAKSGRPAHVRTKGALTDSPR
eukprot:gene7522-biopygen1169